MNIQLFSLFISIPYLNLYFIEDKLIVNIFSEQKKKNKRQSDTLDRTFISRKISMLHRRICLAKHLISDAWSRKSSL